MVVLRGHISTDMCDCDCVHVWLRNSDPQSQMADAVPWVSGLGTCWAEIFPAVRLGCESHLQFCRSRDIINCVSRSSRFKAPLIRA